MLKSAILGPVRWSPRFLFVISAIACLPYLYLSSAHAVAQDTSAKPVAQSPAANAPKAEAPNTAESSSTGESSSTSEPPSPSDQALDAADPIPVVKPTASSNRFTVLVGSLTIFVLAIFVGFEVINKVHPTLHTPLMSGSNAISGITIVGALLATGFEKLGFGSVLGMAAVILAMINVAGGFWVTHRMLAMFKKKK